jgi:hypothetical protein
VCHDKSNRYLHPAISFLTYSSVLCCFREIKNVVCSCMFCAGAMGVRTVHQKEAKAQLVVRTSQATRLSADEASESGDEADWLDDAAAGRPQAGAQSGNGSGIAPGDNTRSGNASGMAAAGEWDRGRPGGGGGGGGKHREHSARDAQPSARSVDLQGLSGDSDVLPVPRFVNAEGRWQEGPSGRATRDATIYSPVTPLPVTVDAITSIPI